MTSSNRVSATTDNRRQHRSSADESKVARSAAVLGRPSSRKTGYSSRLVDWMISQLAVFMLCFQSCSTAVPVSACTSVSTNSGTGLPTTLWAGTTPGIMISLGVPAYVYFESNRFKIFGIDNLPQMSNGTLSWTGKVQAPSFSKVTSKLFVANSLSNKGDMTALSVQIVESLYSLSFLSTTMSAEHNQVYGLSITIETMVFFSAKDRENLVKFTDASGSYTTITKKGAKKIDLSFYVGLTQLETWLVFASGQYLSLYNKVDMQSSPAITISSGTNFVAWCVDSISDSKLYGITTLPTPSITLTALAADTVTSSSMLQSFTLAASVNNILNFGPYQYVVTITSTTLPQMYFLSKIIPNLLEQALVWNNIVTSALPMSASFLGFFSVQPDQMYFAIVEKSNWNFQSYYLTVDRCVNRDVNRVCQQCLPSMQYYRMGSLPDNTCNLTSEFPIGWGIDNSQPFLAQRCLSLGCLNCSVDYAICTVCNNTADWYLYPQTSTCYSTTATNASAIPIQTGIDTATKLLVQCAMDNCINCTLDINVCTGCLGNSFVSGTNGSSVTCSTAPACNPRQGYETVTSGGTTNFVLRSCSDPNCIDCCAAFDVCKRCDTSNKWYLNYTANPQCQNSQSMAPGKGPDTSTLSATRGYVVECKDPNCRNCTGDYTLCLACQPSWYLHNSACYSPTLTPQIPEFYGANSNGAIQQCNLTNCRLCKSNYMNCEGCNTAQGWYLYLSNTSGVSECQHATLSPVFSARFGPDTTTGLATSGQVIGCSDGFCVNCHSEHTFCSTCDVDYAPFQGKCFISNCSLGFGNDGFEVQEPCKAQHCLECCNSSSVCVGCDTAAGWYLDTSVNPSVCQHATIAPIFADYFGPDTTTGLATSGQVIGCSDGFCVNCKSDYQICTACDTTNGYYLRNNVCVHTSAMPVGEGPNLVLGIVVKCAIQHCTNCSLNYTDCTECDTAGFWVFDKPSNSCTCISGYGMSFTEEKATGLLVSCKDPNCEACCASSTFCAVCKASSGWLWNMLLGVCQHFTLQPTVTPRFGFSVETNSLLPCSHSNCLNCSANYQICTECDQANGYILEGGSCKLDIVNAPKLIQSNFMSEAQSWILEFDLEMDITHNCSRANLTVTSNPGPSGKTHSCQELGCEITDIKPNGFSIKFNSQYSISYGTATLYRDDCLVIKSKKRPVLFVEYPVLISVRFFGPVKVLAPSAETTAEMANSVNAVANVALMSGSPASAVKGDMIGNQITLLLMLSGPQVIMPEAVLNTNLALGNPLRVGNQFAKWTASETCDLPDSFARNDLVCSIFGNYGEDLIVLSVVLGASGIIHTLVFIARRKLSPEWKKTHAVLQWIQGTFGLPFFIAKMDGNQFELMAFSIYNIVYSKNTPVMVVGDVVSVAILLYIAYQMAAQFYLAVWIWRELEQKKKQIEDKAAVLKEENKKCWYLCRQRMQLKDVVDFQDSSPWVQPWTLLYDEYSVPARTLDLFYNFLGALKNLLIAFFLMVFGYNSTSQVAMILALQVYYFGHTLVCNIKVSLSLRIVDILTEALILVYIVFKLITTLDSISEDTRQKQLATAMVVCVYGIIVVSISFALFSLMLILFQLSKQIYQWVRSKMKSRVHPMETDRNIQQQENDIFERPPGNQDNSVAEQRLNESKPSFGDSGMAALNDGRLSMSKAISTRLKTIKAQRQKNQASSIESQLQDGDKNELKGSRKKKQKFVIF